jgi:hypothetical protein
MKKIIPFVIITFILVSCQKEYSLEGLTPPIGPGTGIVTNCNDYFPLKTGNLWQYSSGTVVYSITVQNNDSTIDGNIFHKLTSDINGTSYAREENGNFYEYSNLGGMGNIIINPLRTNANVGEKWSDTLSVNGVEEIFQHEMLEKNISYKIGTDNYPNVIHTRYSVSIYGDLVQTTDSWFGKCIGPLETKTVTMFGGVSSDTASIQLKSYTIR